MTILITGGSRGIGKSLVEAFCRQGHTVFFCYEKSVDQANALEKEMRSQGFFAKGLKADVADFDAVLSAVSEIQKISGSVDVLINNAGISLCGLLQEMTDKDFDRLFDVNVKGTFHCIKAVLPDMLAKKSGRILNISSVWGITGASMETLYSSSKAAVIGLTKALAKELGPSGITVNCIAPGVIDTDMNSTFSEKDLNALIEETPMQRLGKGNDVASLALFLSSENASFLTGQTISADGGFAL